MPAHYVYLISNDSRHVKIGHSNNPRARIANLATSSPEALFIEHTWKLADRALASQFETALHDLFRYSRIRREWHSADPEDIRAVGDMLLVGDDERADLVCKALAEAAKHMATHEDQCRRASCTSKRWATAKYYEHRRLASEALDLSMAAHRLALARGLPESDWLRLAGA